MQLPLADTIFGMTYPQFALLLSGIAIIWTIRRWRMQTIRNARAARANAPDVVQSAGAAAPAPPATLPVRHMREVTTEVHALLADLEETSRRLTAQLDNRYTKLEQLMAEADEKIRRLEALAGGVSAAKPAIMDAPQRMGGDGASHAALAALSDAEQTLQRLRTERGAPPPAQDPAYQPIYSLSDLGKSPREIAQQLNRQPGEIELILALRAR